MGCRDFTDLPWPPPAHAKLVRRSLDSFAGPSITYIPRMQPVYRRQLITNLSPSHQHMIVNLF
jgi:hypothetical protein